MKPKQSSLMAKILRLIGIPVALTFCAASVILLFTVSQSVSEIATKELTANSKAVSNQIETYFTKYLEVTRQMATNPDIEALMLETTKGVAFTDAPTFPKVQGFLDNVQATDTDNIVVSWIADFDSSQFIQSDEAMSDSTYDVTSRAWYQDLQIKKKPFFTEPYVDAVTKNIIVSVVCPLFKSGTTDMIGATCLDISITQIKKMLADNKIGETGFYILTTDKGTIFQHPNEEYDNLNVSETKMSENIIAALTEKKAGSIEYSTDGTASYGYVSNVGDSGWVLATGLPEKEFKGAYSAVQTTMLLIFAFTLILIAGLIVFISRRITRPIKELAAVANKLAVGDLNTDTVIKHEVPQDEVEELAIAFKKVIENTKEQAEAARQISEGNLSVDIKPRSPEDVLGISMESVIATLKDLSTETENMIEAAIGGNLETRGDADKFKGEFKTIVSGFNQTLDAITGPLSAALPYIEKIANGQELEDLDNPYHGVYGALIDNLISVKNSLQTLIAESAKLTAATADGNLSYRADASKLNGRYVSIVSGFNESLDSVIGPMTVAAGYIEQIGKGNIPEKITTEYNGDFNNIKNSINSCIDGLDGLVEGRDVLAAMKDNDYTKRVNGSYNGIFSEIADSVNAVSTQVNHVVKALNDVADGDLKQLDELRAAGKKSENDTLMPTVIKMLETIKALADETAVLSAAAISGDLNTRGKAEKFSGEYANIINGINQTLDAVTAPIVESAKVLEEVEKGNLGVTVTGDYKGEHAIIKNALNKTIENLRSYILEISSVLAEIGNGNLDLAITAEYTGDFVKIKDSLNSIIASLSEVLGNIGEAAEQVNSGARQVSDGSQALSQGSTEQASSIEELSASIADIASQTKQNAINANRANELASEAKTFAEQGNIQMRSMLDSMTEINEASASISRVIKVIDDIAFQTNILALNAAVEAARAGQHGKGFAVVAEEVRNLAARSADAVKETAALIEGSVSKVGSGTKIANETAGALKGIVEKIGDAADLVKNIAEASNMQATGISQIDKGIEQVASVVQNNSATAEESAAASEELSSQSEFLKEMVGTFKTGKNKLAGRTLRIEAPQKEAPNKKIILLDEKSGDKY